MPEFLTPDVILELHRSILEYGESRIADTHCKADLLDSALNAVTNAFLYGSEARIPQLAGILCSRLARNHCFLDGNKRVAAAVMIHFLDLNGFDVSIERQMEIHLALEALLSHIIDEEAFCARIQTLIQPRV